MLLANGLTLCGGTIVDATINAAPSSTKNKDKARDSQQLGNLLHGQETRLYGDSAYAGQQAVLKERAPKARDFTNKRAYRNTHLGERDKEINTTKSQTRAKVQHPCLTLKKMWGLAKNANRPFAMLALINIDRWNKPLGA